MRLKFEVDPGDTKLTVVFGIAKYYTPEYLAGKSVVLLVNLKLIKFIWIRSKGMVLAAVKRENGAV